MIRYPPSSIAITHKDVDELAAAQRRMLGARTHVAATEEGNRQNASDPFSSTHPDIVDRY
ncbi:hypothetical protein LPJ73_003554, partial [Coemansia sp. RSA 2703]